MCLRCHLPMPGYAAAGQSRTCKHCGTGFNWATRYKCRKCGSTHESNTPRPGNWRETESKAGGAAKDTTISELREEIKKLKAAKPASPSDQPSQDSGEHPEEVTISELADYVKALEHIKGAELLAEEKKELDKLRTDKFEQRPFVQQLREVQNNIARRESWANKCANREAELQDELRELQEHIGNQQEERKQAAVDVDKLREQLDEILVASKKDDIGDVDAPMESMPTQPDNIPKDVWLSREWRTMEAMLKNIRAQGNGEQLRERMVRLFGPETSKSKSNGPMAAAPPSAQDPGATAAVPTEMFTSKLMEEAFGKCFPKLDPSTHNNVDGKRKMLEFFTEKADKVRKQSTADNDDEMDGL